MRLQLKKLTITLLPNRSKHAKRLCATGDFLRSLTIDIPKVIKRFLSASYDGSCDASHREAATARSHASDIGMDAN